MVHHSVVFDHQPYVGRIFIILPRVFINARAVAIIGIRVAIATSTAVAIGIL